MRISLLGLGTALLIRAIIVLGNPQAVPYEITAMYQLWKFLDEDDRGAIFGKIPKYSVEDSADTFGQKLVDFNLKKNKKAQRFLSKYPDGGFSNFAKYCASLSAPYENTLSSTELEKLKFRGRVRLATNSSEAGKRYRAAYQSFPQLHFRAFLQSNIADYNGDAELLVDTFDKIEKIRGGDIIKVYLAFEREYAMEGDAISLIEGRASLPPAEIHRVATAFLQHFPDASSQAAYWGFDPARFTDALRTIEGYEITARFDEKTGESFALDAYDPEKEITSHVVLVKFLHQIYLFDPKCNDGSWLDIGGEQG